MGCCQICCEIGIQEASEQRQGFTQIRGQKGSERRKTLAFKGKDLAISKAKDLVAKGKDLAVKKGSGPDTKSARQGSGNHSKSFVQSLGLQGGTDRQYDRPTGTLGKIKTLTFNAQVQRVLQKRSNELIIVNLVLS